MTTYCSVVPFFEAAATLTRALFSASAIDTASSSPAAVAFVVVAGVVVVGVHVML